MPMTTSSVEIKRNAQDVFLFGGPHQARTGTV